jgi:hypothetical protein
VAANRAGRRQLASPVVQRVVDLTLGPIGTSPWASRRDLNFIGSMSGPVIPTDLNDRYQSLASRHDLNFIGSMSGPVTTKWSLMKRMVIWRPE